jgi:hypothetical protein
MASSLTILSGVDFTPSDIKYSKPRVDARGSKSVGILNAAANTATYISTPLMITWGVNEYIDDKKDNVTYDMALQFPNEEYSKPETTNFMNNMIALEKKIKDDAITHAKEWFGKAKMSEDAIDALWTPMLKYPKDKNTFEPDTTRAPTIKVKIPFWKNVWNTELYNLEQVRIFPDPNTDTDPDSDIPLVTPKELIVKGAHMACIIQCGGIWFANGKFGVTWKLKQGVIKPKMTLNGTCHISLSSQDKQIVETQPEGEHEENCDEPHVDTGSKTDVVDSDVEDNHEQSASPDDAPKKKIVKKKVVKKTN